MEFNPLQVPTKGNVEGLDGNHPVAKGQSDWPAELPGTNREQNVEQGPANEDNGQTAVQADDVATLVPMPSLPPKSTTASVQASKSFGSDGDDEEQATAICFQRSMSPTSALQRNKGAEYQKVGEEGICKMHRFSLYETASRYYLVGGDIVDRKFRILKIDRTAESGDLSVAEDEIVYTRKEMNQLLNAVDDGNKASGGLKLRCSAWGLLGFIRFTGAHYMLLITKRSQVAMIGGHYIYQIDGTELISLTAPSPSRLKLERDPEEARFVSILNNLDLSRSFYFSYSYDISRSLQHNIVQEREALRQGATRTDQDYHKGMFVWNHHLLRPASQVLKNTYDWCIPIIHGYVDQATLSIYGRMVCITIIARRSRFFAGARFLKRGVNDLGYVANDVETEQIVSEMLTTSFHAPGPQLYANSTYSSYVQHRGSIPLHWTQINTGVSPKPDIDLNLVDPFYSAAALHFDDLFERYGAPVYVLNLVKARERTPRESILLKEYTNAIMYLNQFLPDGKKIVYRAWDMSRASKSRDQDVMGTLESIAKDVLAWTGFFRNGDENSSTTTMQNGIARTNCIDCLDRTNAAQFVIGKCALGHQLRALGILPDESVEFDTDAVNVLNHMYHGHGDTIAIQYGGSHLVNTVSTYRKINQWSSHSRDMVESFKRYYNNSFMDGQRQEAYNLFLGNYTFVRGQPLLWDLSSDYYLHFKDPRTQDYKKRKNYTRWYDPHNLRQREMPLKAQATGAISGKPLKFFDDYWLEYYRPLAMTPLLKVFSYRLNSLQKYRPVDKAQDGSNEVSPFEIKSQLEHDYPEKGSSNKSLSITDAQANPSRKSQVQIQTRGVDLPKWLQSEQRKEQWPPPSIDPAGGTQMLGTNQKLEKKPKDKSAATQWTLDQFVTNSLNPSVVGTEADEYLRYVNHPMNLPMVVSTKLPVNPSPDFLNYIHSNSPEAVMNLHSSEEDIADFTEFLEVGEDPLTVTEADTLKKRYKAYRQWLKGKSLFKQQRSDA